MRQQSVSPKGLRKGTPYFWNAERLAELRSLASQTEPPLTVDEIAARMGLAVSQIHNTFNRFRIKCAHAEARHANAKDRTDKVKALHAEGLSTNEIAERLSVPSYIVHNDLRNLGLKTNQPLCRTSGNVSNPKNKFAFGKYLRAFIFIDEKPVDDRPILYPAKEPSPESIDWEMAFARSKYHTEHTPKPVAEEKFELKDLTLWQQFERYGDCAHIMEKDKKEPTILKDKYFQRPGSPQKVSSPLQTAPT